MAGDMMHPRNSPKIYPRPDNYYRKKASLNFDVMRTKIFADRDEKKLRVGLNMWIAHALVGITVGTVTFALSTAEDNAVRLRKNTM